MSQEGLPTIGLGVWIWMTMAPSPLEASFLTVPEREHVAKSIKRNKVAAESRLGRATSLQHTLFRLCNFGGLPRVLRAGPNVLVACSAPVAANLRAFL